MTCPCAFRLRRLAQNVRLTSGVRHFSCNFSRKKALLRCPSACQLRSHKVWVAVLGSVLLLHIIVLNNISPPSHQHHHHDTNNHHHHHHHHHDHPHLPPLDIIILNITILHLIFCNIIVLRLIFRNITSSTAQGGGGSFKNRKPIGEVGCCESGMAERIHWWTEGAWGLLAFALFFWLSTYLPIYLLCICLSIDLSLSLFHLSICLSV